MKLVSVPQIIAIEQQANAAGLSYPDMMQNAGNALAGQVITHARPHAWRRVLGLVGAGNNGGDTLIALTRLAQQGWQAQAYIVRRDPSDPLIADMLQAGAVAQFFGDDPGALQLCQMLQAAQVVLDGLLGTGATLPLRGEVAQILETIAYLRAELRTAFPFVVAVDCPSGVDCDTGQAWQDCLPANLTVCMAAVKQGLLKLPAFNLIGELVMVEIGLPADLPALSQIQSEVADPALVSGLLPDRPLDAHKGTFGTALIAAGCLNYTGAALLAGAAAYRIGTGLVSLAVPQPLQAALAGHLPEATWVLLPHQDGFISARAAPVLLANQQRATALLLGPGLGSHPSTAQFTHSVISNISLPLVLDADGLRHLADLPDWQTLPATTAVLTPHPGEMSALTGLLRQEILANRRQVAIHFAREWGHVVVLKGAFTVVASPSGHATVIPIASPALARAGTGDVLAGMIAGLRAQGLDAYAAARAGAYIHASAGLMAAKTLGTPASVLASDLLNSIPATLRALEDAAAFA